MTRLIYLLLLFISVLTACSITCHKKSEKDNELPKWKLHLLKVRNLSNYQIRGAFAYLSNLKTVYAHFFWQQINRSNYRLLLLNPLGNTKFELNVRPGLALLTDNKGLHYATTDAEDIIGKITNMQIPLNNLRQWILGLPGDSTDYKLDTQCLLLHELNYNLKGETWTVIYRSYNIKTIPVLPSKIELTNNDRRIKLKINSWIVK